MIDQLSHAWGAPDLRRRFIFLITALLIFVVGTHIPTPGIVANAGEQLFRGAGDNTLFNLIDMFSGGALRRFSVFAMGIMPYINASIMMSLLTSVFPTLKELQQEGDAGRKVISRYTRYLAVVLGFLQGVGLLVSMRSALGPTIFGATHFDQTMGFVVSLLSIVGGTCFLMWLGEEITRKGIGNGVSLLIFVGIIARIPAQVIQEILKVKTDAAQLVRILFFFILCIVIVTGVVYIQLSYRKIPIQYARRQIGRKVYGGQSTYLPIRVAQAGVIPIIFAVSVLLIPGTLAQMFHTPWWQRANQLYFSPSSWVYSAINFALVVIFTFVYTAVTFNTYDIADNLKKHGGAIPGIKQGRPTYEFLDKVLHRVTFFGAMFLGAIAVIPALIIYLTGVQSFWLGGTSLLIVVGVALDTVQQLQAHLVMRHYAGFTK